jgi:hypothetical protein
MIFYHGGKPKEFSKRPSKNTTLALFCLDTLHFAPSRQYKTSEKRYEIPCKKLFPVTHTLSVTTVTGRKYIFRFFKKSVARGLLRWYVTKMEATKERAKTMTNAELQMSFLRQGLSVSRLRNGYILVTDHGCKWDALYNGDGTYRSGAVDTPRYRQAALEFVAAGN